MKLTTKEQTMLKVYITDLAAYNSGYLIGEWVTLPIEREELTNGIQQILQLGCVDCGNSETHEEWFITDYDWENEYH